MKTPIVIVKKLPALGMALFPFILLNNANLKNDKVIINHEKIHLRQQLEMLILPFYVLYIVNYLVNRLKYNSHDEAYRHIVFEQEAYQHDFNLKYLSTRKSYAWLKYR
ncbi:hypothetical protein EZJ43_00035 [Pedobacter changchengzhani]|uniref:DUF4157 domain-containing protein n=1 Tax=Pedobacter changchengzhani TaxID=2529274 RepID=A0A4R5MP33_9SPHI|nr:hypothetical protein [Pedobacter changchengzhani]TDG37524.1 hypothetical protein EZJ43_00035 [Pedobacter changchengzhani]